MKKRKYITPATEVAQTESESILVGSLGSEDTPVVNLDEVIIDENGNWSAD
jgi:hypothetical protein